MLIFCENNGHFNISEKRILVRALGLIAALFSPTCIKQGFRIFSISSPFFERYRISLSSSISVGVPLSGALKLFNPEYNFVWTPCSSAIISSYHKTCRTKILVTQYRRRSRYLKHFDSFGVHLRNHVWNPHSYVNLDNSRRPPYPLPTFWVIPMYHIMMLTLTQISYKFQFSAYQQTVRYQGPTQLRNMQRTSLQQL